MRSHNFKECTITVDSIIPSTSGAKETAVASGLEALQALDQFIPDVLMSDVGKVEMNDYMLMQQIRALGRIFLHGVTSFNCCFRDFTSGCDRICI